MRKSFSPALVGLLLASGPALAAGPSANGYLCQVMPSEKVELASPISGVLEKILADRGDRVSEGQVVASLRSDVERAEVELAEAKANSTAQIKGREAKLAFAERRYSRNVDLAQSNVISANDMDSIKTEREMAAEDLGVARDSQKLAIIELRKARAVLDLHTMRSPISGVVTERKLSPGDLVRDQPVMVIQKVDPLHVEVALPLDQMAQVKKGTPAQVSFDVPGIAPVNATVTLADPVVEATSNTFGVRIDVANPKFAIPSGIKCHVQFNP